MRRLAFWAATAVVGYGYVVFPVLVLARGRLRPRPHRTADISPPATIIVPAHNEATSIVAKIENLLALDYPAEHLEIIVASDGSDDGTVELARALEGRPLRVLDLPRAGKAAALNAAAAAARGDILVMTDANSLFAADSLRALVRPFADPAVGGVAGDQVYLPGGSVEATAAGERGYWSFDRMLKRAESRAGNVIGATGSIYAIRRELFRPVGPDVSDDFYLSLAVIAQGKRLVFADGAVAYEPVMATRSLEFQRKVRVMTRGLRCIAAWPQLLDPRRSGFYALQLFSHKIVMRLMALPLVVVAAASLLLVRRGPLYRLAALSQAAFYGLGGLGLLLADRPRGRLPFLSFPAYFVLANGAALRAVWEVARGRGVDRWVPPRSQAASAGSQASPSEAPSSAG